MVLTPTYYVFKMFKAHQNNTLLGSYITTPVRESDGECAPQLIESASVNDNGTITSTVVNTCPERNAQIDCEIAHTAIASVKATIISGDIHSGNTFENKYAVVEKEFTDFEITENGFKAVLPPCSIVKFTVK